ncbi:MAG: dienelactone hydrolase family protein [Ekhidna sp.]|nr:dienelactone hydrolase family protein [Ekhidna sp.]
MSSHETYKIETSSVESDLKYELREPFSTEGQVPLFLLMHGVGSNEKDLFQLKDYFPDGYVISLRAPFRFGPSAFGWYQVDFSTGMPVYSQTQALESREILADFVDKALDSHGLIDPNQVYLVGFSQGAIMSYSVAIAHPEKVKGIIAMSGRMLTEDQEILRTKNFLDVEVHIVHSTQDPMLPYSGALEAKKRLENKVRSVELRSHENGHGVDTYVLQSILSEIE